MGTDGAKALIVVADQALASSLQSMLQALGVATTIQDPSFGLDGLPLTPDAHLIADLDLLRSDPGPFFSMLRAGGWGGAAVLMSEQALAPLFTAPSLCWTLEKPFVAPDLVAIFRQIGAGL